MTKDPEWLDDLFIEYYPLSTVTANDLISGNKALLMNQLIEFRRNKFKQVILTELKKAEKRGELKTALIILRQAEVFNKLPISEAVAPSVPEYFVKQIEVRIKNIESKLLEMDKE